MTRFAFEDLTLAIPPLWDKPWDQTIKGADGIDREFLVVQARYVRLLRQLNPAPVTPEKIAWLAIWSRLFGALTGARGASIWKSRFSVTVLGRVAYEANLHLEATMLPVLTAVEMGAGGLREEHWVALRERLQGYLAWSLCGDQLLFRHVSSKRILDETFDPRPERELIKNLGDRRGAWEALAGQRFELVSDQEALHDRARAAATFSSELTRIAKWLSDDRLRPWVDRYRELEKTARGSVSLFSLLGVGDSVGSFLRSRRRGIGYFEYLKGSAFIHGSSLDAAMLTAPEALAPDFANLGSEFETTARRIIDDCQLHALLLEVAALNLDTTVSSA